MDLTNQYLKNLIFNINKILPLSTLIFIITTYLVMALINAFFLPLPKFLSFTSALILAFGRFLIVFTDFLTLGNTNSPKKWQKILAFILTGIALVELWLTLGTDYLEFRLPIFLNIGGIIILGLALELSFLEKSKLLLRYEHQSNKEESPTNTDKSNFLINQKAF